MDKFVSQKLRFYSFVSMVFLVFVHGYNLDERYLQPFSIMQEPLTFTSFTEFFFANGLLRFRIPMLFVISGYLFALRDDRPYLERVQKRTRTLIVPYLIWSMIGLLTTLVLERWVVTGAAIAQANLSPICNKALTHYSFGELMAQWIMAPLPFQLWFIRCLFMYNVLYPWLKKAVLRAPIAFLGFAGLLWMASFGVWLIEGEGLLFFSLGIWLGKTNFNIQTAPARMPATLALTVWVASAGLKTWMAFHHALPPGVLYPSLIILHKLTVFSGLAGVWFGGDAVVRYFMDRQWFAWLSGFAFIIYALHVPITCYAINLAFTLVPHFPGFRMALFVALPVTVIAFCVLTGAALRRVAPSAYSLLTGGRGLKAAVV